MSNNYVLEAQPRTEQGKGASRRLRREHRLPAIVYGAGKEPAAITMTHHVIQKYLDDESFYSQILTLDINGEKEKVVLRDVQRHPSKALIMHMDLLRIDEAELIRMHVPLHFINEEECPGVKVGGQVSHQLVEVEILCLPSNLPEFIEVDLGGLALGESLHMSDIKLPTGVEIPELAQGHEHDLAVVTIYKGRTGSADEEGGEEPVEESE
jgi:large subunit ribosomal protein L25